LRFFNRAFDLQYILRRTPWDTQITPPEVVELVEGGNIPTGRGLDLGCGTGTNCIYLARRGWQMVGVDFSTVAIRRARRKARRAGVGCTFYRADVTDLSFLEEAVDFVLDIGCLHSIPMEGWERYAAEVARLARPEGLYMLYAFVPRPDRRGPRGVSPAELRDLFEPAFVVERQEGGGDPTGPSAAWYWMRRIASDRINSCVV
jgi:SAM-dependent methyltransferase